MLRACLILTAAGRPTILVTSSYNVIGFNHLGRVCARDQADRAPFVSGAGA